MLTECLALFLYLQIKPPARGGFEVSPPHVQASGAFIGCQRGHLMATPGATVQWLGSKTQAEWGHAHPEKAKGRWKGIPGSSHCFSWSFLLNCVS